MSNKNTKNTLPKMTEIPIQTLGFINSPEFINSFNDHSNLQNLSIQVNLKCTHLQNYLNNLHATLSSLLVSCISNSISVKSSIDDVIANLDNLSIVSSFYGSNANRRKAEKIVDKDLAYIARELRRIDNVRQYAEVVIKLEALVGDLEDAALSALNRHTGDLNRNLNNVHRGVEALKGIEDIFLTISKSHPEWHNLLKTVDSRVDKILSRLRPQVIADHRSLLTSLGWPPKLVTSNVPNPLVLMEGVKKETYTQSFLSLCALQHVHLRRQERKRLGPGPNKPNIGLWAIDELVSPIASKIEPHLLKWADSDQPELMFALVYKVTRDFIQGVDDVLQPLIDKARLVSCSAKESWVMTMIQVLSDFLAKNVFPDLAVRYRDKSVKSDVTSSWLHMIDQILKFDKQMQSFFTSELYLIMGESSTEQIRSMSTLSIFCDRPDWVHIWARIELKDAWTKLKPLLKDEKSWFPGKQLKTEEIEEYCLSTGEDHKCPQVAEFALKTTWELIQRCQTLPGTQRRMQFIKYSPTKFLLRFFKVLQSEYSSIGFPTCDFDEESLVRVCQLVNAARFSEFKLREWSDDVDLLELNGDTLFFEKEIENLLEMETNWLMDIITHILKHFEETSSYYFSNMEQFEVTLSCSHEGNVVISSDFVVALDELREKLILIKEHLNAKDLLDTWRSVAEGLDHYIFRSVTLVHIQFSEEGVKQFMTDIKGLFYVFKPFCARPEAFFPCVADFLKRLKIDS